MLERIEAYEAGRVLKIVRGARKGGLGARVPLPGGLMTALDVRCQVLGSMRTVLVVNWCMNTKQRHAMQQGGALGLLPAGLVSLRAGALRIRLGREPSLRA